MRLRRRGKTDRARARRRGHPANARLCRNRKRAGRGAEEARRRCQRDPDRDVRLRRPRQLRRFGGARGAATFTAAGREPARYAALFDPMDGSSNIDVNGDTRHDLLDPAAPGGERSRPPPRPAPSRSRPATSSSAPRCSSCTSSGEGVHVFALDPSIGEFLLCAAGWRCRAGGGGTRSTKGAASGWPEPDRAFVDHLKEIRQGERAPLLDALLGLDGRRRSPDPPRRRDLPLSRGHRVRKTVREDPGPLRVLTRWRSSSNRRGGAPRPAGRGARRGAAHSAREDPRRAREAPKRSHCTSASSPGT